MRVDPLEGGEGPGAVEGRHLHVEKYQGDGGLMVAVDGDRLLAAGRKGLGATASRGPLLLLRRQQEA